MPADTLETQRRAVATRLGRYALMTTTATPTAADAARWLVFAPSVGQSAKQDGSDRITFVGDWAYLSSGAREGTQRRLVDEAPGGAVAADSNWGDAIASGVEVEVTYPLPSIGQHGVIGLSDLVRMALRDLWSEDYLDITTVADQQEYSLSNYTHWLRDERILGLLDPPRGTGRPKTRSRFGRRGQGWDVRFDGGTPTLVLLDRGYPVAGYTLQLHVRRPAYTLVSGSESLTGPTIDAHTTTADLSDLVEVALLYAYRLLSTYTWLPADERARYAGLIAEQEAKVARLDRYDPRERPAAAEEAA